MNTFKKMIAMVLMVAVISFGVTGCEKKPQPPAEPTPQEAPTEQAPAEEHPAGEHPN